MKAIQQERRTFFRVTIITLGLLILALSAKPGVFQDANFWAVISAIAIIAFLVNFPLNLFLSELTSIFMVTLGTGLILGVPTAVWITAIGATVGLGIQSLFDFNSKKSKAHVYEWWIDLGFEIGYNITALTIAFLSLGF